MTVCPNNLLESIRVVDEQLLKEIERTVLTPEARRYTLTRAAETVRTRLAAERQRLPALRSELARTKREAENLLRAIESGKGPQLVLDRLTEKEHRLVALESQIQTLEQAPGVTPRDIQRIDRILEGHLERFGEALHGDIIRARQAIRKLLVDRVKLTPVNSPDGKRTYEFEAHLTLGNVLTGETRSMLNVPDGI